jgi:NAD(P)H-hydrate epimerase
MIEDYGISLIQMMENAGRNLARLAAELYFSNGLYVKKFLIMAGSGGNGGGALVAARHLKNFGANPSLILSKPGKGYKNVPLHQLQILQKMAVHIMGSQSELGKQSFDLIIDGLIGYSLAGAPKGETAHLINWANSQKAPILSLDIPSGMDATSGEAYSPAIVADITMTLVLPKTCFLIDISSTLVPKLNLGTRVEKTFGTLFLADIGVPSKLYKIF